MNICSCDLTALVNILRHFCIIGTTGNNNRTLGSLRKKKKTQKSHRKREMRTFTFSETHTDSHAVFL